MDDPYNDSEDKDSENEDGDGTTSPLPSMTVDVDLGLSAFANARKYCMVLCSFEYYVYCGYFKVLRFETVCCEEAAKNN